MVEYIIGSLLLAWFLSVLGFDPLFITGVKELFGLKITIGSYYIILLLGGVILAVVNRLKLK